MKGVSLDSSFKLNLLKREWRLGNFSWSTLKTAILWMFYAMEFLVLVNIIPYLLTRLGLGKFRWKFVQLCAKRALSHFKVEVQQEGRFPEKLDGNTMIIANHKSWFDIFLIIATYPERVVFFAKKDYFRFPILGSAMKIHEHIPVEKGKAGNLLETEERVKRSFKKNGTICIFPEGTRFSDEGLLSFKKGAFQIASKHKVKVLPIYHYGCEEILNKERSMFAVKKGTIKMVVGQAMSLEQMNVRSPEELEMKYREEYKQHKPEDKKEEAHFA